MNKTILFEPKFDVEHAQFFQALKKFHQKKLKHKKTVLIGGCFDLLHYGHLQFLQLAKLPHHILVVALESDQFIHKNKRSTPVHNQEQRKEILENLAIVDYVISIPYFNNDQDYMTLTEIIKPNIIAVTQGDSQLKNKQKQATKVGAKVKVVTPLISGYSTSQILKKLQFK